ncbi:RNA polymerase sigma-70 factor, ECF subfamily protein [Plesiocystis pacifica SIR-1]|uniref:RNA polymerase sigma-70 factor, ECF subfamily protein n=2 Tax=Plesiocystis pacifica TaxID=191768 RepID=A6G8B6_9BACT|nr:RNA polymerase sigma-70 factor, ECF subfamily protein [Plesiocystis pacifica SIR-1]
MKRSAAPTRGIVVPTRAMSTPPSRPQTTPPRWSEQLATHRKYLWAVGYRLMGDVQDADDLVQATFERALARPPQDLERALRPWLTRVATNLGIDLLRKRKQRAYDGPWLPAPVEELVEVAGWTRTEHGPAPAGDVEVRYGQLESARHAFLLALEALEPRPRAVLLLRDVLGYSGPEVADILGLTPANVRVVLHRARKTLDAARAEFHPRERVDEADARTLDLLQRLMVAVASDDAEALERLFTAEVVVTTDAGGEYTAARKIVRGAAAASALLRGISRHSPPPKSMTLRPVNGEPALLGEFHDREINTAPRALMRIELDPSGERIRAVQVLLASRTLAGLRPADSTNA